MNIFIIIQYTHLKRNMDISASLRGQKENHKKKRRPGGSWQKKISQVLS